MRVGLGIYSATSTLALLTLLPLIAFHPRLRGGLRQRLGGRPSLQPPPGAVWFHGSSAGDVVALLPLIERLRQRQLPVTLSTWTRAGEELARQRIGERTVVFRQPLDLAGPVRAVVRRLRPRLLVLECLELWPRLVGTCQEEGVPVAVVNGRLSARSLRRYKRLRWLFEPCFSRLALVTALSEEHAARFVDAGVPAERVVVVGSTKHGGVAWHDRQRRCCCGLCQPATRERAQRATRSVRWYGARGHRRLVLGSVHDREMVLLQPQLARLLDTIGGLEVVIAPRYPHRARRLQRRLRAGGIDAVLQSSRRGGRVTVVDQMGRLAEQYTGARVAFVGGSLIERGGHNVVEPAARGAFVLTGPHVDNCEREVEALCRAGAAAVIADGATFFEQAARRLCEDDDHRSLVARSAVQGLAGAADQVAAMLVELLAGDDEQARC